MSDEYFDVQKSKALNCREIKWQGWQGSLFISSQVKSSAPPIRDYVIYGQTLLGKELFCKIMLVVPSEGEGVKRSDRQITSLTLPDYKNGMLMTIERRNGRKVEANGKSDDNFRLLGPFAKAKYDGVKCYSTKAVMPTKSLSYFSFGWYTNCNFLYHINNQCSHVHMKSGIVYTR